MRYNTPNAYLTWVKNLEARGCRWNISGSAVALPHRDLARLLNAPEVRKFRKPDSPDQFPSNNPWGNEQLKARLAETYGVVPEQLVLTSGASLGLYVVCRALLQPGDDVLVPTPTYQPFLDTPWHAVQARVHRVAASRVGVPLDFDKVERALKKLPRPGAVILANPANPTGAFLGEEGYRSLADLAGRYKLTVIIDEIFRDLTPPFDHFPKPAATFSGRFVSLSSLSKVYGLGALRCGWVISAPKLAARIQQAQVAIENIGSAWTEAFAAIAVRDLAKRRAAAVKRVERNRNIAQQWLSEDAAELVHGPGPEYGSVWFPRLRSVRDAGPLVEQLIQAKGVALAPGAFFGAERHVRIGLGGDGEVLQEGLRVFGRALRRAVREQSG